MSTNRNLLYRTGCIAVLLWTLLFAFQITNAQGNGQLCVRSFEDRNGNGQLDGGEPLLTRGVNVNLTNSSNITIASALLDQSPTAAQGVVCFPSLAPGQYTVTITSTEYTPTTPASITTAISDNGLPAVVQFGGRLISSDATSSASAPAATTDTSSRDQLARVAVSGVGALIVVVGMIFLGIIVYAFAFRNRRTSRPVTRDMRRTTTTIRAVPDNDASDFPEN